MVVAEERLSSVVGILLTMRELSSGEAKTEVDQKSQPTVS